MKDKDKKSKIIREIDHKIQNDLVFKNIPSFLIPYNKRYNDCKSC